MKHCIVTPELVHLYRNGGVGTNSYYLAQFLSSIAGEEVTILYTQEVEEPARWREVFQAECGAKFVALNETEMIPSAGLEEPNLLHVSLRAHRWLSAQSFDVIHFQNYQGSGFCAFQAKRLGEAYQQTHLISIINGPLQWVNQGMERFALGTLDEIIVDYMERYCAERCDTLVSPSYHLVDWMRENGWSLPADVRVIRSYLPRPTPIQIPPPDPTHLVFFNRLEFRKGIKTFTEAAIAFAKYLKELPAGDRFPEHGPRLRISYVGRNGVVNDETSADYLANALKNTGDLLAWEALTNLEHHQALQYIEKNADALFVFPAAMDSFAFVVQEGVLRGLKQIVSNRGGVSEFFSDDARKFEPSVPGLFRKLCEVFETGLPETQLAYDYDKSVAERVAFIREVEGKVNQLRCQPARQHPAHPLISVCVPHFNLGKYLPATLECIARQTYPNLEVIVVDDGSTDERSREVFAQMQALYQPRGWKFIQKPCNSGLSDTRNFATQQASGELFAFVDSDNLPFPEMLEGLYNGLHHASLDVISCYLYSFIDGKSPDRKDLVLQHPSMGGCVEASLFRNLVGDANLLIRKSAFMAVNGFRSTPKGAYEDHVLLVRLLLAGFKLESSSSIHFAYRRRPDSLSKRSTIYAQRTGILEAFTEGMSPWQKYLFYQQFGNVSYTRASGAMLARTKEKLSQEREKRRERDRKVKELGSLLDQIRKNPFVRLGRFLRLVKF